MLKFALYPSANVVEVSSACLVLARAGYEVATTSDSERSYLLVEHSSETALRAASAALLALAFVEEEITG
jgi:hypothetical protein